MRLIGSKNLFLHDGGHHYAMLYKEGVRFKNYTYFYFFLQYKIQHKREPESQP